MKDSGTIPKQVAKDIGIAKQLKKIKLPFLLGCAHLNWALPWCGIPLHACSLVSLGTTSGEIPAGIGARVRSSSRNLHHISAWGTSGSLLWMASGEMKQIMKMQCSKPSLGYSLINSPNKAKTWINP